MKVPHGGEGSSPEYSLPPFTTQIYNILRNYNEKFRNFRIFLRTVLTECIGVMRSSEQYIGHGGVGAVRFLPLFVK